MSSPRHDARIAAQVLGVWIVAAVVALWVASTTRIGPVVLELSPTHGVHLGDVLAVLTCTAWAQDTSAGLLRRRARAVPVYAEDRRSTR